MEISGSENRESSGQCGPIRLLYKKGLRNRVRCETAKRAERRVAENSWWSKEAIEATGSGGCRKPWVPAAATRAEAGHRFFCGKTGRVKTRLHVALKLNRLQTTSRGGLR